jgi:hypothetical protein
MGAIH